MAFLVIDMLCNQYNMNLQDVDISEKSTKTYRYYFYREKINFLKAMSIFTFS